MAGENELAGWEIERSHLIDRYETGEAKVRRELAVATQLLADGLHALRDQRYHVTDEFVGRAIGHIASAVSGIAHDR